MPAKKVLLATLAGVALLLAGIFAYGRWTRKHSLTSQEEMLWLMPADSSAVCFLDLKELKKTAALAQLLERAPSPSPDNEYAQFLQSTGFNYENDLDRLALSLRRQAQGTLVFAVADGRFDRKKIESFASEYGALKTADGKTLFAVPLNGSHRKVYFTFLGDNRIAWANDSSFFFLRPEEGSVTEWRERFARLAGSPIFGVLRQDSGAAAALVEQAPGGLQSPQLATLLAQLNWISIGAKPDGNLLRVGIEGECVAESTEHQLKDLLSGLVVLAEMGLNDPKTQKKLNPLLRDGYMQLLQSTEIRQTDRGESKSVRIIFDVPPKLLEAAQTSTAASDQKHAQ